MRADFEKGTKVCSRCKRELPISEYRKESRRFDGLCNNCNDCEKERSKIKREKAMQDPVRHAKMLEAWKRYHQTDKGKEKAREYDKKRRDTPEKRKKIAEQANIRYHATKVVIRPPRTFIIDEEGQECLKCCRCGGIFPKEQFHKESANPLGHSYKCKKCKKMDSKEYLESEKGKAYYAAKARQYKKEGRYKESKIENFRRKYETDPDFRILTLIRVRVRKALIRNSKRGKTIELLGCSIPELKNWLELQFEKGMTWDNYGFGPGKWQIDHILPCARFDFSKESHQRVCFNYRNLQPLWGEDNNSKKAKLESGYESFLESIKEDLGITEEIVLKKRIVEE